MAEISDDIGTVDETEYWQVLLERSASAVRHDIAEALFATGGGHYGGSFSAVELLVTLYARHLRIDPDTIADPHRDRFILSKGHAAIALYAVLRRHGLIEAPLASYAAFNSPLEGHPDMTAIAAVDWSTGSLGQGLSAGLGMAIGLRHSDARIWVMLGDGECQEGQVWEAAMLAGLVKPRNLNVIIDVNCRQEYGWHLLATPKTNIEPVPDMSAKWRAFGWHTIDCDGNNVAAIDDACNRAAKQCAPTVILAHTRKGYGTSLSLSDPPRFHCTELSADEHATILTQLARS